MFGDVLKTLIIKKYGTFSKFADICDVPKSTLSDVINNKKLPREKNLNLYMEKLKPLSKEDETELLREWAFGRTNGKIKKDVEELEIKNKNMLEVLKTMKSEKVLLEEVAQLKEYEAFYNLFFKDLSSEETKTILKAMVKELKVMSIDSPKKELLKEKFEKLDEIIDKI